MSAVAHRDPTTILNRAFLHLLSRTLSTANGTTKRRWRRRREASTAAKARRCRRRRLKAATPLLSSRRVTLTAGQVATRTLFNLVRPRALAAEPNFSLVTDN